MPAILFGFSCGVFEGFNLLWSCAATSYISLLMFQDSVPVPKPRYFKMFHDYPLPPSPSSYPIIHNHSSSQQYIAYVVGKAC